MENIIEIVNKSPSKVRLIKEPVGFYVLDFGVIDASVTALLEIITPYNIKGIFSSCGCTTSQADKIAENTYSMSITYSSSHKGSFSKTVSIELSNKLKVIIKVKGTKI